MFQDSDFDVFLKNLLFLTDAFLLHANGIIDANGDDITDKDIMAHALANLGGPDSARKLRPEDKYFIKRGSTFISEYARIDEETGERTDGGPGNPNHLLGAFPYLFPYGCGGFEVNRKQKVPYEVHSCWALQYADRRFRKDYHFVFQVYGVMHKRNICRSACLQIKRSSFMKNCAAIMSLMPETLKKASKEEMRHVPFSHPGVRALRKQLSAVRV